MQEPTVAQPKLRSVQLGVEVDRVRGDGELPASLRARSGVDRSDFYCLG